MGNSPSDNEDPNDLFVVAESEHVTQKKVKDKIQGYRGVIDETEPQTGKQDVAEEDTIKIEPTTSKPNVIEEDTIKIEPTTSKLLIERRLILLGTIGSGKSATGNTILFQTVFESQFTPHAVTKQVNVCRKELQKLNKNVVVVDTPGIRVTRLENDEYAREVIQSIDQAVKLVHPGPHAYLLVVSIPRFSELDTQLVKFIRYHFKRILSRMIIIFTGYDVLKTQNKTLNTFKEELPDEFKKFIDECQKRVLVFHNGFQNSSSNETERTDHNNQVAKLLQKVEDMPDSPMDVHQNKISEIPNKTGQTINFPISGNATFRRIGKPLPGTEFLHDDFWLPKK